MVTWPKGKEVKDIQVAHDRRAHIATVTMCRPPNNHLDTAFMNLLADTFHSLDRGKQCRAIVLCSQGKHFSAGRDFSRERKDGDTPENLYAAAIRLMRCRIPWIAAVHGSAVGGGLGLAMAADFRVGGPASKYWANFAKLGFHQGFGLTVLLPRAIGAQATAELLYLAQHIRAPRAAALGLIDRVSSTDQAVVEEAQEFAAEIAASAPLAVRSIRSTLRRGLLAELSEAVDHEAQEQQALRETKDFGEGSSAMLERRTPDFHGR